MAMLFTVEFLPLAVERIDVDDCSEYAVRVSVRGSLDLEDAAEAGLLLRTLAAGGAHRVILNLEQLGYIDSTGIGAIIRAKKDLSARGGDLALLNVPPNIKDIFELVNLKGFVRSFYDDDEALLHLAASLPGAGPKPDKP
ncbi:MAG: STAS domain-containing protein [Spirochaetia bacterium]|nr:STAS domain-containing protein [Spirochaetia bacterium]